MNWAKYRGKRLKINFWRVGDKVSLGSLLCLTALKEQGIVIRICFHYSGSVFSCPAGKAVTRKRRFLVVNRKNWGDFFGGI